MVTARASHARAGFCVFRRARVGSAYADRCGMRRISQVTIVAVVLAACSSSSSNPDLGEADASTVDGSFPETGAQETGGFDSGGSSDTSVSETSISDSSAPDLKSQCVFSTGEAGAADGGDGGDGAASEGGTSGTSAETESNDTAGTANALLLNGVECGQIAPATDVDFFKFTLPASAQTMQITFEGNVTLKFTVGSDAPVTLTPSNFPQVGFHPGSEYTIEVHSFDGQPQTYAINITAK